MLPIMFDLLEQQNKRSFNLAAINETIHYKNYVTNTITRRRVFISRDNKTYIRPELNTTGARWQR